MNETFFCGWQKSIVLLCNLCIFCSLTMSLFISNRRIIWRNEKFRISHHEYLWINILCTVTLRCIHITYFILMHQKSFFLFKCWPNRKKVHYYRAVSFLLWRKEKKSTLLLLSYISRKRVNLAFFYSVKNIFSYKSKETKVSI